MSNTASSTADLIFPLASLGFSTTLSELKRSALSVNNRLRSIITDSEFVCQTADCLALPLVANERCGSWYIPASRKAGGVYFKSTDGHMGEWSFSLRRLNFQLFDVIASGGGCIVVDSTRRGKSMPDALSKTVPIWCCVMNALMFPDVPSTHELHTDISAVSESEQSQIRERLDALVQSARTLNLDIENFKSKVSKPLRPFWVTQDDVLPVLPSDCHPVVCCTASRRVRGTEMSEGGYIQGAGDDAEGWSHGLTPSVFWANKTLLLGTPEDELPELIAKLIEEHKAAAINDGPSLVKPTSWLSIGARKVEEIPTMTTSSLPSSVAVVTVGKQVEVLSPHLVQMKDRYIHLECRQGKLGSRDLRKSFTGLQSRLAQWKDVTSIRVLGEDGKDLSVGAALYLLCILDDGHGNKTVNDHGQRVDKTLIKQRLSWIMMSCPDAKPSRATLQSVNDALMSD